MNTFSKEAVTVMSYITGVSNENLIRIYSPENNNLLIELRENSHATLIRTLSIMRTRAVKNYNDFSLSIFTDEELKLIDKEGITLPEDCNADECIIVLNHAIYARIDECKALFPANIKWQAVYSLLVTKGCIRRVKSAGAVIKKEIDKYRTYFNLYPFQVYIHWEPHDCGNMFDNDKKFYSIIGVTDIEERNETEKTDIDPVDILRGFIQKSLSAVIAVDCENSNAYKLMNALKSFDDTLMSRIHKIMLITGNTIPIGWQTLKDQSKINTEIYQSARVLSHKSTADITLATEISREHYTAGINSFIIVSSDSDFLSVISSLKTATFMMMTEDGICSLKTTSVLTEINVPYCSLDDFPKEDMSDYKSAILLHCLKSKIDAFNKSGVLRELNYRKMMKSITDQCKLELTDEERREFINHYLLTLKLALGNNDRYFIEVSA